MEGEEDEGEEGGKGRGGRENGAKQGVRATQGAPTLEHTWMHLFAISSAISGWLVPEG